MSDLTFEPSAIKCAVCGKYSHTFDEGNRCREIEYLRLVHDYAFLKANHESFKKEALEVIGFYGDPKNWNVRGDGWVCMSNTDKSFMPDGKFYAGKRARAFMQKWEER